MEIMLPMVPVLIVKLILDLAELIKSNIEFVGPNQFSCQICSYQAKKKHHIENHIEANHIRRSFKGYTCDVCLSSHSTKNSLNVHKSKFHRKKPNFLQSLF